MNPVYSVVVPCYNEEDCLLQTHARLSAAMQGMDEPYEIIYINDGSRDKTPAMLDDLAARDARVRVIHFARNAGHQMAVSAGLDYAAGQAVVIIDADLQDPPELLGEMMTRMDAGFDVVFARRRVRAGESAFKRATAHGFYRLLSRISDVEIPVDVGDFRLMNRAIVDKLNAMPEQDRFLRGMVAWLGGRQTDVLYDRDMRSAGATGYSLSKMLALAASGITGFSTAPLQLAALVTGLGVVVGVGIAAYVLRAALAGETVPGWTSLALVTVFFSCAQLACLAIMSLYISRIFKQVKQRPLFLIQERVTSPMPVGLAAPSVDAAEEPAQDARSAA